MTNYINSLTTPVQIYVPAGSGTPHVWLFNQGNSTCYVGGPNVTPFSGIPLPPNAEIKIPAGFAPLYAVGGVQAVGTTTTTTAAANAGATALALTASIGAIGNFAIVTSSGASQGGELVQFTAVGTASTVTPALLYDHKLGSTVTLATLAPTTVHVEALTG